MLQIKSQNHRLASRQLLGLGVLLILLEVAATRVSQVPPSDLLSGLLLGTGITVLLASVAMGAITSKRE